MIDGQLFGSSHAGQSTTISLENNEFVSAFEYYNFPNPGHLKWDILWRMELCAMSIFSITTTDLISTQKQYGPYATTCVEHATERVYVEVPIGMSFQDFLAEFSTITDGGFIGINAPTTNITTTTLTTIDGKLLFSSSIK